VRKAERIVLRTWPEARPLIARDAPGRQEAATEKQFAMLRKRGFPPHVLGALTKGDAAAAIAQVFA
jgi:hypothetical protein